MSADQLPLPGLEPLTHKGSPLVEALRRSIAAMDSGGLLEEIDALELESMLALAKSVDKKAALPKSSSTLATDVVELVRIKRLLAGQDVEGKESVDDDLAQVMARWTEAADREHGPVDR